MSGAPSTIPNSAVPVGAKREAEDAAARTLYVRRKVLNPTAILEWARAAGFKSTLAGDDLHVTVAYSKAPVDWSRFSPVEDDLANEAGAPGRAVERLGQDGEAVVLRFDSPSLAARWREFRDGGASWDYPEYRPHLTISYDADDVDVARVAPYSGEIQLGPEVFAEVKPGWMGTVKEIAATDSALKLALDAESVREKRKDGQLVVKVANISKANVCPYRGSEIPGWEQLGLERDRIYNLLRDPEELKKAAPTLNGVQLLQKHVAVNADDHRPYDTVGSLGTDADFDGEYLKNSLFVNAKSAIEGIESGAKRELSAGYHYKPDMTPGNFRGTRYDGVMRDIVFNHVALVEDGRAGPDVVIGDSRENVMKPTRFAAVVLAATASHIAPLLAMDSKVTIGKDVFKGLSPKSFKDQRAGFLSGVRSAVDGKLKPGIALDATMEDLAKAVDAFTGLEEEVEDESPLEEFASISAEPAPEPTAPEKTTYDAEPLKAFLREKGMDEESIMKACDMLPKPMAGDEDGDGEKDKDKDKKDPPAMDSKNFVSKQAFDEALKVQGADFAKQIAGVRETERGIRAAIAEVKPWVGELAPNLAFDSAADVHRHALKMLGVDGAEKLHADALLPILKSRPLPGARPSEIGSGSKIAMDASVIDKAAKLAPGLANIQTVA